MFSFDEKILALSTMRSLAFRRAVALMARLKRLPETAMREVLMDLDRTHFLLEDGVIEITPAGVLQFTEVTCPKQPKAITQEYFDTCKADKQTAFLEAFTILGCTKLFKTFKPFIPVKKDPVYAKKTFQSYSL